MDLTPNDSEQGTPSAESGTPERRAHPRAKGWGTAWIGIFPEGTKVLGYLLDLGQGGCCIETDDAIPAGGDATVEVVLHLKGYTVRLAGMIRHQEKSDTQAGIEFTDVSPRKADQIQKLLDQLLVELG